MQNNLENGGHALLNGYQLEQTYQIALTFFKEKDGKAFHLTYAEKNEFMALVKQVRFGPYQPDIEPDRGLLDMVGRHRTECWKKLGELSREDAQAAFIGKVEKVCPQFSAVVEAHFCGTNVGHIAGVKSAPLTQNVNTNSSDVICETFSEDKIRQALREQTREQFCRYAQDQVPQDLSKQAELVEMLHEQHYLQYMSQLYHQEQQQRLNPPQTQNEPSLINCSSQSDVATEPATSGSEKLRHTEISPSAGLPTHPQSIAVASMWTRKDIDQFKSSLSQDPDGVLQIGSGEVVTVRVPTHAEGSCLFWEFATDLYDIGFGLSFEWSSQTRQQGETSATGEVLMEVQTRPAHSNGDVANGKISHESASSSTSNVPETGGQTSNEEVEVIPMFRRESQKEIYCGSHPYPCQGVYLLRFDNSYSLWRSKVLYYRVYYSR